jgi:hypothetical protein
MRSLCSGRKQTSAPPPKLPARVVDLSLLLTIASGIYSALFSNFTASLTIGVPVVSLAQFGCITACPIACISTPTPLTAPSRTFHSLQLIRKSSHLT